MVGNNLSQGASLAPSLVYFLLIQQGLRVAIASGSGIDILWQLKKYPQDLTHEKDRR